MKPALVPLRTVVAEPTTSARDRLVVRCEGVLRVVRHDEIVWANSAGHASTMRLRDRTVRLPVSLGYLERALPEGEFCRINRSTIVRTETIVESRPKSHGDHWVTLDTGERWVLSRLRRVETWRRLGCLPGSPG